MRRLALSFSSALALLGVLVPTAGQAGPPESSPPPPDPPADLQVQGQGAGTQIQGPGTQSQQAPPGHGGPAAAPNIQVNPQIQVQVQPTIDARAEPKADADADAKADAKADAEPQADAKADVSTELETEQASRAAQAAPTEASTTSAQSSEPAVVPAPGIPARRRIRVVMRNPGHHHNHHDHGVVRQRGRGLLTAGIVSFGAGYATAAINGGLLYDQCETGKCRRMARELFVPVAGPFMAMQHAEERDTQIKLGLMGGAQSFGVLLGLVGASVAVHDARQRRRLEAEGIRVADGIHVAPHADVGSAGLTLRGRF